MMESSDIEDIENKTDQSNGISSQHMMCWKCEAWLTVQSTRPSLRKNNFYVV